MGIWSTVRLPGGAPAPQNFRLFIGLLDRHIRLRARPTGLPQPDGHTSNCQSEVVFAHEIPLPTDGALRPVRARGNGLGISFTDEYLNPGFSNARHRRSGACPGRRQPLVDPGQYGWQAAWAVACP